MQLKKYKNKYGYERVDCPFCGYDAKVAKVTSVSPDPLRDLKRHITNQAKNEALLFCIDVKAEIGKHLAYYKAHTSEKKVVITNKRHFDDDLKI